MGYKTLVEISTLVEGYLSPGASPTWFFEPVSKYQWWMVVPRYVWPEGVGWDQIVEISEVYYIRKGFNHAQDGTGGAGDLQANVTLRNKRKDAAVYYSLVVMEA